MLDLFEMYKEEMSCQVVVGVFDRAICVEAEFDALEPLCVVPADDANVQLEAHRDPDRQVEAAANMPKEPNSAAPENPEAAADIEPDRETDMFDNAEEYVGVDNEGMYDTVPPAP